MNIFKYLRYLLIDQYIFGVAEGGDGGGPDPSVTDGGGGVSGGDGGAGSNPFAKLPETWRGDLVTAAGFEGDDAAPLSNMLERVGDLKGLLGNYKSMTDKIRSGEISSGLPENPTDEQLSAYREANGVPTEPKGYTVPEGVELTEYETEIFNEVFGASHNHNLSDAAVQDQIRSYKAAQERVQERQLQQDGVDAQQGVQVLKEAWGPEYQTNINMVEGFLTQLPESVRDSFKGARMADGRGVLNSPEVMQFLSDTARKINPAGAVVPNSNNPVQSVNDEIKKIENMMREKPQEYWADKDMQNRLQQLYTAQEGLRQ